ncbi:MAG: hypothetical protein PHH06_05385 [Candidatus Gracilibacteria bacterium]|nr:hypothetical protein [Candidatus Gracilibacteria bacterium]
MPTKKSISFSIIVSILSFVSISNAAYTELDCSVDPIFSEYSCNQCFEGESQAVGSNIGFMSDQWINTGSTPLILFKDEQDNPEMIPLNGAIWQQVPNSTDFWEYTSNMEDLYNDVEGGYILLPGQSVDWIQSKLGSAYTLLENASLEGENIGLITYPIVAHRISSSDDIEVEPINYKECVLFKSAGPTQPVELPETGPESMLLLLVAMLLGLGLLKITKSSNQNS